MDLAFSSCLARLFLPRVESVLESDMAVHQTGRATAIRLNAEPFVVCEMDDIVRTKLRNAFGACVRLIHFYRRNRELLTTAAAGSIPEVAVRTRGGA
jgi:hypothetical protein